MWKGLSWMRKGGWFLENETIHGITQQARQKCIDESERQFPTKINLEKKPGFKILHPTRITLERQSWKRNECNPNLKRILAMEIMLRKSCHGKSQVMCQLGGNVPIGRKCGTWIEMNELKVKELYKFYQFSPGIANLDSPSIKDQAECSC